MYNGPTVHAWGGYCMKNKTFCIDALKQYELYHVHF